MLGVRSLFWECGEGAIAIWGCGSAIAFGDVGMRSLLGFRGAIAVLGMWGCDRFWDVGMRSLLGMWECDRLLGMLGVRFIFGIPTYF